MTIELINKLRSVSQIIDLRIVIGQSINLRTKNLKFSIHPIKSCLSAFSKPQSSNFVTSELFFPILVESLIFSGQWSETVDQLKDYISVMGLSPRQFAALVGAGYAVGDSASCDGLYCRRNSFSGSATAQTSLSNVFFNDLINNQWEETIVVDRQLYKVIKEEFLLKGLNQCDSTVL